MKLKPFKKEKRSNKYKLTMIILSSLAFIFLFIAIYQSFAAYNIKHSETIVDAKVGSMYDIRILAIFIDGEPQPGMTDFPTDKDFSHVRCYVDGEYREDIIGTWESDGLKITGFTHKTDCNVYFISTPILLRDAILSAHGGITAITAKARPNFDTISTTTGGANGGMFAEPDGMMGGTSYYFRGTHDLNNNVLFAGFQWKVIRIDGAGNIRMIYNGTEAQFNSSGATNGATAGTNATLATGTVAFNPQTNNNSFVNYNNSPNDTTGVRGHVNAFFNSLSATDRGKIVTTAYCNDRTSFCDAFGNTTGCGTGTLPTWYASNLRLAQVNKNPTLACPVAFRISLGAALITADEFVFAGKRLVTENTNSFLRNNQPYWSMSPNTFGSGSASLFRVVGNGALSASDTNVQFLVRPVISLNPNALIPGANGGNGSATNPYRVQ